MNLPRTPFTRWLRKERAPGVTEYERRDKFTATVLTNTPHIHLHYFTTDADLAKDGGWAHLVCHECQVARSVRYPDYDDAALPADGLGLPSLRAVRERFVSEHGYHGGIYAAGGGRMLCPPDYRVLDEIDLRRPATTEGAADGA